jgi:hypothetical protein
VIGHYRYHDISMDGVNETSKRHDNAGSCERKADRNVDLTSNLSFPNRSQDIGNGYNTDNSVDVITVKGGLLNPPPACSESRLTTLSKLKLVEIICATCWSVDPILSTSETSK